MNDEQMRPGTRRFCEVRGGELYEVVEVAYTPSMMLAVEHMRASRIAHERGLPGPPPLPPDEPGKDEKVICVERSERKLDARFYTRSGMRLADWQIGQGLSFAEESAKENQ